jgi:ribosomal protein S18 acetylase RimI-like enzyme
MADSQMIVSDDAVRQDLDFLEEQVDEYNSAATGFRDGRLLVILLRDPGGRIYGGLSGHTWGSACEVKFIWVEESRRRSGIGSRLLEAAEKEARLRGCHNVVLSTHSFQAPDFYRKLGYVAVGEFSDYPRGHSQLLLQKSLS